MRVVPSSSINLLAAVFASALRPDMEQGRVVGANTGQIHVTKLNERDLLDYRAIQRTFDGAYARTALGQLCYAIVILRLFQAKFFYVGEWYDRH